MPRVRAAKKPPADGPAPASVPDAPMAAKRPPPKRRVNSDTAAMPPTPPQTTHKRKRRSRSRVTDSSSEESDQEVPEPESDGEEERRSKAGEVAVGHKKRRTLTLDAIAEELTDAKAAEDAFWMGESSAKPSSSSQPPRKGLKNRAPTRPRGRSRTRSPSSSPPPAPYMLQKGHSGLMSPPPSRRAPIVPPRPATPPPPREEKEKGKELPVRDSPNNPFLNNESPAPIPTSEDLSPPEPRTPKKHAEKPVLAYVFRGTRMYMANPHLVPEEVAAEVEARDNLPVDHPEYVPSEACPPKLLFPGTRKADLNRRRARAAVPEPASPTPAAGVRRAGSTSSDGSRAAGPSNAVPEVDDGAMAAAMAKRINARMRKGVFADGEAPRTRSSSRDSSVHPKLPEKDRSDPVKRALGPVRK
ncbi:uncharacterized protein BXZ73DRAFT_52836 [Epithele typhae]|uniref:uncharacterized protein n=1 Tax=Epithele typhae TaxID=378194 RepID=UPI0020081B7F|nr:uncharacterized protein BXZ73DRAFT_52836 [Epithele typhae]KAH9918747.1 hypothetical protein BXZ73DRAFT_52836 [Epithele typhae]